MNYILFDEARRQNLLPLTFMRPVADIRFGILTIREKWNNYLNTKTSTLAEDYLAEKFPLIKEEENIIINGAICPNPSLVNEILKLKPNQTLVKGDTIIAIYLTEDDFSRPSQKSDNIETDSEFLEIVNTWDIFHLNDAAIEDDFNFITKGRKSQPIPDHCIAIEPNRIFIEEGAQLIACTLNATDGPIYIGRNATVMEGSNIRGPFALCESATVKMASKIYGGSTIGPHSKVGGEVNNSVIFGFSNKAHDGFLGNSVIAEWCNLGADTNTSNLKNTYESIKLWSYSDASFVDTGLQFCGLIMGDHSKSGINTMFNTGTVVGVSSNIFGSGFQRNFIPSFRWGGTSGYTTFLPQKAINVATNVYQRRNLDFDQTEQNLLKTVFDLTHNYRRL